MKMLPSTIVFAAFVSACACTLSARAEEPDSAKQLIGIMETVSGIAREAVPLAKQEFPLLDAKFKGDQYNNLIGWLRTPVESLVELATRHIFRKRLNKARRNSCQQLSWARSTTCAGWTECC